MYGPLNLALFWLGRIEVLLIVLGSEKKKNNTRENFGATVAFEFQTTTSRTSLFQQALLVCFITSMIIETCFNAINEKVHMCLFTNQFCLNYFFV